jgi:hypothetical protein
MKPNIVFLSGDAQPLRTEAGDRRFWAVGPQGEQAAPPPAEAATEIGAHPSMPRRRLRTRLAGWVVSPIGGLALLLISTICMGAGLWHLAARLWHVGV